MVITIVRKVWKEIVVNTKIFNYTSNEVKIHQILPPFIFQLITSTSFERGGIISELTVVII